jgi:outer membrane lipopolysaccharide assembly protein LptE/RlpB
MRRRIEPRRSGDFLPKPRFSVRWGGAARRLLTLGLAAGVAAGCGYTLVGMATNLPPHVQSIYVAPLTNETRRAEVEQVLSRAVVDEMVTRRRFEVVNAAEDADAILEGAVTQFMANPLTFDDLGRATEYQIVIHARVSFRDRVQDRILWESDRYVYRETYEVEDPQAEYFDREILAIEEASGGFARTLVMDVLEGF